MALRTSPRLPLLLGLAALAVCVMATVSRAQGNLVSAPPPTGPLRMLAPGVMRVIPPQVEHADSYQRHDLTEILAVNPQFGQRPWSPAKSLAKDVRFPMVERDPQGNVVPTSTIWGLEFAFKPVRFVRVPLPPGPGQPREQLVWYMVYYVKNLNAQPVPFVPRFTLFTHKPEHLYPAELLPTAIPTIQKREDPHRPLLNMVEITGDIPPSTPDQDGSVWGVVTWTNIDPSVDRFSVLIEGLTNAYRWEDAADAYKPGDPLGTGRTLLSKTLEINFWRPGDALYEHEQEIRIGIPGEVDYRWVYR